jgi:hypothetical protein
VDADELVVLELKASTGTAILAAQGRLLATVPSLHERKALVVDDGRHDNLS